MADLTKSTFPPMPGLKGVTQHIAVMFDTLTLGSEVDMGDGPPQVTTELFHLDGKEHFGTLNPGTVLVATQINPRRIEIRGRQDGREFPTSVYEVSPDGKTLTIKQATGMEVVGVYNRSE